MSYDRRDRGWGTDDEHDYIEPYRPRAAPGKSSITSRLPPATVQRRGGAPPASNVLAAAERGVSGPVTSYPHQDVIQRAFGRHSIEGIRAHTGAEASRATRQMGAIAFATGAGDVAFRDDAPDLFTAAHEAAHVVQQRAGLRPAGGLGQDGDPYERQADAVAARVVAREPAEDLLDGAPSASASPGAAVQRQAVPGLEDLFDSPFSTGDASAPAGDPAAGSSFAGTVLRQGASGPAVEFIQGTLNTQGASLVVDGLFGQLTHGAVGSFQESHGLVPDGVVGPLTWAQFDTVGANDRTEVMEGPRHPDEPIAPSWCEPRAPGRAPVLLGGVYFATNSVELTPQAKAELDKFVDAAIESAAGFVIGPGIPDPNIPMVRIEGNHDPRSTSREGGNPALAFERALEVTGYLRFRLNQRSNDWKERVIIFGTHSLTLGVAGSDEFARSALLIRESGFPLASNRKPEGASAETGRAKAQDVLERHKSRFGPNEWRRLSQMCRATHDGYYGYMDPLDKMHIHTYLPGKWTPEETVAYAMRKRVGEALRQTTGSQHTDEEIVSRLRSLYQDIAMAIHWMHRAENIWKLEKDLGVPAYIRRQQMINFVADGTANPNSIYFQWGIGATD